jgi:hypothetical protein
LFDLNLLESVGVYLRQRKCLKSAYFKSKSILQFIKHSFSISKKKRAWVLFGIGLEVACVYFALGAVF